MIPIVATLTDVADSITTSAAWDPTHQIGAVADVIGWARTADAARQVRRDVDADTASEGRQRYDEKEPQCPPSTTPAPLRIGATTTLRSTGRCMRVPK